MIGDDEIDDFQARDEVDVPLHLDHTDDCHD